MRLVVNLIRNKSLKKAVIILKTCNKKSAPLILKCLNSAQANAVNNNLLNGDKLFIDKIFVNEGKSLKRMRPRAKGRSDQIIRRSSHLSIYLKESNYNESNLGDKK